MPWSFEPTRPTMIDIMDIIDSLDVRRMQVLIEAAIVEVTADFSRQLGSELALGSASSVQPARVDGPSGRSLKSFKDWRYRAALHPRKLGDAPLIAGGRLDATGTSFAFIIKALAAMVTSTYCRRQASPPWTMKRRRS